MKPNYKLVILLIIMAAVIVRLLLLFFAPISMFADPVIRYLPNAEKILHGDFSFYDFPLFIILEAFWMLFLSGKPLWIAWKLTSFIFFIGILFLLPSLFKRLGLNKKEQIILLSILFFSTWSILLSVTVMQDMMVAFLTLALFLSIENYFEKASKKWIAAIIFLSTSIVLTKATGYIILAGFGLYILSKKNKSADIKRKIKPLFYLSIGALLSSIWLVKNYLIMGSTRIWGAKPQPISLHSFQEYLNAFIQVYHYFWEIPLPGKVNLSGIFASFYSLYYIAVLSVTAILILITVCGLIKYYKRYGQYILLMLPLFGFGLFYEPFLVWLGSPNAGRYTFPLWLFLFFFPAKFISSLKGKRVRHLCYIFIVLFCIASTIAAYGITLHMKGIDDQLLQIGKTLKERNATGSFITNDEFTSSALGYYLGIPVKFNITKNIIDINIPCKGDLIFFSKNFDVFREGTEYRVCRV